MADLAVSSAEKVAAPAPAHSPTTSEWAWVLLLIASLFTFDLVTYNFYPAVWCDEVLFSEPAIHRVQHGSFTTTVWEFQPGNTFPVVNCPLYSLALVPWLSVTGTSLLAVRSFNFSLMALATFLIWLISWRFGLVNISKARISLLVLLHFGYGMSYAFRCSRPDILGLDCLLTLLLSFKIRQNHARHPLLFALAAVAVWIGLQVALFACLASATGWVFFRRPRLRELVFMTAGLVVGACSLFVFLKFKGVLSYFLPIVVGFMGKHYAHSVHVTPGAALLKIIRVTSTCYLADFTTVLLVPGIIAALLTGRKRFRPSTIFLMLYCLFLIFAVPAVFNVVGHFGFYYSYMLFIPGVIAIFAACSELFVLPATELQRWLKPLVVAVMIAGTLVGLPLRLAITLFTSRLFPRAEIQRYVHSSIAPKDVVFSDYGPFFEVKNAAAIVYAPYYSSALVGTPIPGHDFTPQEKESISVLVIRPQQAGNLTNFFGGRWKAVTEPFGDTQDLKWMSQLTLIGKRLAHYGSQPQTERYQIQIFQRLPADYANWSDP
jgi:hypothetical protein